MYNTKYTKKLFNDLYIRLKDDIDFMQFYKNKNARRGLLTCNEYIQEAIREYLQDDYTYLDKQYLDISHVVLNQYGRAVIVNLDEIYNIFTNLIIEHLQQYTK